MRLALEERAGLAQLGLRMQRRDLDAELLDLEIRHRGDAASLDDQLALGRATAQESQRSVTDAADDSTRRVGFADFAAEQIRASQVERRAPSAGEEDDVVAREI